MDTFLLRFVQKPKINTTIIPPNCRPYVCNLLVDPSCRGRGYGRQLMAACEVQSAAWGQTEVFLHVSLALTIERIGLERNLILLRTAGCLICLDSSSLLLSPP